MKYATISNRVYAFIIDLILITIWLELPMRVGLYLHEKNIVTLPGFIPLIITLGVPFYFIYTSYKWGYTLGMKWLKIKMVQKNEKNITLIQSIARYLVSITLSSALIGIGFLWAIWDKKRQTWHDKIAKTFIIQL